MTNPTSLDLMIEDLRARIPNLDVQYKTESKFMKLLGYLLAPVNPTFSTDYVTTIGTTVYYPSRKYVRLLPTDAMAVLAHEFVHMWDEQKEGSLRYKHAYLSPQIYFIPALVAYSVFVSWVPMVGFLGGYLASCAAAKLNRWAGYGALVATVVGTFLSAWVFSSWWAPLALIGALAPLAPWPSTGRTRLELRGYAMSVAAYRWLSGKDISSDHLEGMKKNFTGSAYYFMSRSPSKISDALGEAAHATRNGSILQEEPYRLVYESLKKNGRTVD